MQRLLWFLTVALTAIVPSLRAEFVYETNSTNSNVAGYSIAANGSLIPVPGANFATGPQPIALTVDVTGRFLYTSNSGDGTISGFTIAMTGQLTPIPGSPFGGGNGPFSITVDRSGTILYTADFNSPHGITFYRIDQTTGALTKIGKQPVGMQPFSVAADPVADFLYLGDNVNPGIYGFAIVQPGNAFPAGTLLEVPASPLGPFTKSMAVYPNGKFLYTTNQIGVYGYAINPANGSLTALTGSPFGHGGLSLALDPTGQFAYALDNGSPAPIYAYRIDPNTGALTPIVGSPFTAGRGSFGTGITVSKSGQFVYATNDIDSTVSAFSINAATGALAPVPGSPFPVGLHPQGIVTTNGPAAPADLALSKTHSGNFTQGQIGATYTLTVSNVGATAASGLVTVNDAAKPGLTVTAISGTGWTCSFDANNATCQRSDGLAPASSYPPITITENVAPNAASVIVNVAGVSNSGDTNITNNTAVDVTNVNPANGAPDLTITKTHSGNFTQGQTGGTYTITVTNSGTASTNGMVTVTDTIPTGLTATAIAGSGWNCTQPSGPCTRSESLTPGLSYPVLTLTFNVAANAPATVTNMAVVSGGGETNTANDTANDLTTINTVQATPPTADSVTPNSTSGPNQVFTFNYSSVNGYSYLNAVYALINSSLSVPNGCVTVYVQSTNSIYLANDAGSAVTGPLTPGSASTLSNSQCTINGMGSSVSGSGNTLSVVLSISAKPAFKGPKTIYGYAADNGGMVSGWQNLGTWTPNSVSGLPPTADSVTPNNGFGFSQTFVYKYSSSNGYAYINYTYALINSTLSVPNGCLTLYVQSTNSLYLYNDAGNALIGPITPGSGGSLSNSQCTISGPGSSASGSGNTLTLSLATSFQTSFLGAKTIYGAVTDNGNLTSGWQNLGTYMVRLFF